MELKVDDSSRNNKIKERTNFENNSQLQLQLK